eukprot:TRINITY_DN761_c0_g1_i1.p1 TRINITY_DN761_c0_g1~~TRINITY_DN761_c0_g1_i1.p1  ORF type:complete len:324 (-),score=95.69 TRINITY_DN761_c0_g1_i1:264-1091(-)
MLRSLVGSEMCIRDRYQRRVRGSLDSTMATFASPAQRIRRSFPAAPVGAGEENAAAAQVVLSAQASRYGHPQFDFKAAPSLFVDEDLRQEDFRLAHRVGVRDGLANAEVYEAQAVHDRREAERKAAALAADERAAARYAAETREIERASVAQRAELEAKFIDAENAAAAAVQRADELRTMLASAAQEQARAEQEHRNAALANENAATAARAGEFDAVQCRLANDNCFAERSALESQSHRGPMISSLLGARGGYLQDGGASFQVRSRTGLTRLGHP